MMRPWNLPAVKIIVAVFGPVMHRSFCIGGIEMSGMKAKRLTNPKLLLACVVSSVLFVGAMGLAGLAYAQGQKPETPANAAKQAQTGQVYLLPVQGNISMLAGAG